MALQVDVNSSSRSAVLTKLHSSLPFLCSLALVPDCSFYTVTTYVRCYAPWYKSVIQLGVGLYGIHNLGPAALGSVYPVETSTSLYNLYKLTNTTVFPISNETWITRTFKMAITSEHTHRIWTTTMKTRIT